MKRTLFSLAALAALALAACNGSPTDTRAGDGTIGSGVGARMDTGQGFMGGGTRAEGDTTSRGGGGAIGSGT